ncbi:hypothetical protein M5D96_004527, partial [Drosophila gunungcola]
KETNPEERTVHDAREALFMRLYKELLEIEPDEELRNGYLKICHELFDSGHPKLKGREKSLSCRVELIDRLHAQAQNILHCLTEMHQRHIIAAPRVVIKTFKSNPAYQWNPHEPNAPDFYEQLDQFYEITGQTMDIDVYSIESRVSLIVNRIRKKMPRDISYSDWMLAVGKCKVEQLLTRDEKIAYEALRFQSRDRGDQDLSTESRFTDALHGMMGYESPHLKVSSLTGWLQLRSPHHQESISESYLLLTLGHLGYLYRSLREQLVVLGQQGETGSALRECLQKELQNFQQFYELRKQEPSSLLALHWKTRGYQLHFQWLLGVLHRIQSKKSIVVSLNEESRRRIGSQRNLMVKWLNVASQPLITKLYHWLLSGQLSASDYDDFPIERCTTAGIDDFWQKRYRVRKSFSTFLDPHLTETLISVGKTLAYTKKFLGLSLDISLISKELLYSLIDAFDHFYRYGDQEPLYEIVHKLHFEISNEVLTLQEIKPNPQDLFFQIHKYSMLTDSKFTRGFFEVFEPILEEPASCFNIELFNQIKDQMLHQPIPSFYIDKAKGDGAKCWSLLVLRWNFPNHWRALLGEDVKEYDAIFGGLWRFNYVNYVLGKRIVRQQLHFQNRIDLKYFEGLEGTNRCFVHLINIVLRVMKVLRHFFLSDILEPAFAKLLLACNKANSLDDILEANRTYLKTIKLGSLQTKALRKSNQYLDKLYGLVLNLDHQQQKFHRLTQILLDYVMEAGVSNSSSYKGRIQEFRWSCESYTDFIKDLEEKFHLAMVNFLFSLHLSDEPSLRLLALRLDPKSYYTYKDARLGLVQMFEFKRKARKRCSEDSS